jgi:ZIP family zinc transporter
MGFFIGISFIIITKKVLNHFQGVDSTDINPANLKKMILILFVMTLHSLSEGIGIGRTALIHTVYNITLHTACIH